MRCENKHASLTISLQFLSSCATALYYHTTDNVTTSRLSFRQQTEDGLNLAYDQWDHRAVEEIYGFTNEEATVQELGSVLTCEGRLLTFPNVMQHCVEPFELEDKTQPGCRKLVALFLVDPHVRIISTAEVPPQQKSWWKDVVRTMASGKEGKGGLGLLPVELREQVLDATDGFPISLEEAKHQRNELMIERTNFVEWQDLEFREKNTFNVSLSCVSPLYGQVRFWRGVNAFSIASRLTLLAKSSANTKASQSFEVVGDQHHSAVVTELVKYGHGASTADRSRRGSRELSSRLKNW